jgi:hypothetical protein
VLITASVERETYAGRKNCYFDSAISGKCRARATEKLTIDVTTNESILLIDGTRGYGYREVSLFCPSDAERVEKSWSK